MFRVKPPVINSHHNDLLLRGLFLRRLSRSQAFELCHTASSVGQLKEESVPRKLPSLPVQPLEQMIDKYIKSIKPFVSPSEFEKTQNLAKAFCEDEIGKKLQGLLEERAKSMDNWLADWWLQTAYLEYREPVPIFSSPGLVWPKMKKFVDQEAQLLYTAHLIKFALDFNTVIEQGEIPQDKLGNDLLCMSQYNNIFGTCRIPKIPRDELLLQDSQNPSTNIIVMYNNHLFNVPAFCNEKREPFTASEFYSALLDVVAIGTAEPGVPVGVLTSEHRDNWARSYEELKKDPKNKRILEEYLEKALFVVCLDKPAPLDSESLRYGTRCSKLLLHGYGLKGNAGNRWYDKTIQFVVGAGEDGVGIVYEHSPAEGGPIAVLTDVINSAMPQMKFQASKTSRGYPKPEKLDFVVSDVIKENISSAGAAIDRLSDDLDVCGYTFTGFGRAQLKQLKVSPDSFIQVAIQLAFYKLHGRPGAQYESGSLRKFVRGRTDTIRSCTEEVVNFCEKALDPSTSPTEISNALRRALGSQKNYAREVIEGRGVDRHLLGLKILAKMNNLENLQIFSDPAYVRSTHFQLSTSNVSAKCNAFMIYGPLVHDGYACCYNPRELSINFGLSAWSSSDYTSLNGFKEELKEALFSMYHLLAVNKMASVAHFLYDAENIIDEIESRLAAVEESAVRNFVCARTIQRTFRGFIIRKHVASLHRSASCIQKNWRGFLGRIIYTSRLKEKFDEMCWLYYNANARVIQKCWRGYWVRLKVFSYYRLKTWLAFVARQNKLLKCSVEVFQSKANAAEMKQREEEAKEWIVYILFKLHHLLRTHQLSGVYSMPNTTDLSEIEKLLKCLKYKDFMIFYDAYMEDLRQAKAKELPPYILQQCKYPGHFEREYYEHKKPNKEFLFSRGSYHDAPETLTCMELREKRFSNKLKKNPVAKGPHRGCKCASRINETKN